MKIQTEQNKPHSNRTSISQEFTISFTIIISDVTIVYIGKELECMGHEIESPKCMWLYLNESLTHGLPINIGVQYQLPNVQPTQTISDN